MGKVLRFLNNNPYFNALRNIRALLDYDQKKRGVLMILLLLLNAVFDVFGLMTLYPIMEAAVKPEHIQSKWYLRSIHNFLGVEEVIPFLFALSVIVFIVFLIKNVVSIYILYIQARYSYNIALRLSIKQFQRYYMNGFLFIQDKDIGRKNYDIATLPAQFAGSYLMQTFLFTTELVVMLIIFSLILLKAPGALVILLLVIIPAFFFIYSFTKNKVTKIGQESNKLSPLITSSISESMTAYADVKLSNKESDFLERYKSIQARLNRLRVLNTGVYKNIPTKTNDILSGLMIMLVFLGAMIFKSNSADILSTLGIFAIAAYRFLPSVNKMMAAVLVMKNLSFLRQELAEVENRKIIEFQNVEAIQFERHISFQNVSYQYPGTDIGILKDFNLDIRKGEAVGIIGSSGSGKTTLLNLLLRLIEETEGCLKVDGAVLDEETNARFQKNIGFVQQDVFIKNGSLAENIAFGEENPNINKVQEALKKAMLSEMVDTHPNGINMKLGENGVKLSGGQKQRVGIARALYKDSQILVFDEATSSLDMETEEAIKETISALTKMDYTIIIVAHRITTLNSCDRILELKKGRITREYTYQELFKEKLLTEHA